MIFKVPSKLDHSVNLCLCSSAAAVHTLSLPPPQFLEMREQHGQWFAPRSPSPCVAGCDGELVCNNVGVRKAVSMFWASLSSPCHCIPTPLPNAAALVSMSSADAGGNAHSATLSRLKPGIGRFISHSLQEPTRLQSMDPRRKVSPSDLSVPRQQSSASKRCLPRGGNCLNLGQLAAMWKGSQHPGLV